MTINLTFPFFQNAPRSLVCWRETLTAQVLKRSLGTLDAENCKRFSTKNRSALGLERRKLCGYGNLNSLMTSTSKIAQVVVVNILSFLTVEIRQVRASDAFVDRQSLTRC